MNLNELILLRYMTKKTLSALSKRTFKACLDEPVRNKNPALITDLLMSDAEFENLDGDRIVYGKGNDFCLLPD
uniref:Uncharacterized protein n=1 Tax=Romanomermis culicivorax TaxID=13658 RepID=A0A915I2W8_ROMCU